MAAVMLLTTENQMRRLGASLIERGQAGGVIALRGELGVGKTTLVRGALNSLGFDRVRSPTYTLVELYPLTSWTVAHFDLYRLADPEELEYLGFRDYLQPATLCFIEWPERATGYLQSIDLEIQIDYHSQGRRLRFDPKTARGAELAEVKN